MPCHTEGTGFWIYHCIGERSEGNQLVPSGDTAQQKICKLTGREHFRKELENKCLMVYKNT